MTTLDRRRFLRAVATTGGVRWLLEAVLASAVSVAPPDRFRVLGPVADLRDGVVRLHLPGFQYRSFHDTDTAPDGIPNDPRPPVFLDDGTRLPGRHDGMAAFSGPDGNIWLIRNHELNNPALNQTNPQKRVRAARPGLRRSRSGRYHLDPGDAVRRGARGMDQSQRHDDELRRQGGGVDHVRGDRERAGCRPRLHGPDQFLERPHGFIFEVPVGGPSNRVPIMHAGRFPHEAAAYSPVDNALYLTEDNFAFPSGFYRYLPPNDPMVDGHIEDGGTLQMLKVVGVDGAHLEAGQTIGDLPNRVG